MRSWPLLLVLAACDGPPSSIESRCDLPVRRVAPWPGGGLQVTVEGPLAGGQSVARAPGLTLVALGPAAAKPDVEAFLASLPEGERVGAVGDGLLAELTTDRAHVLARFAPGRPDVATWADRLAEVGGAYGPIFRQIVVFGMPAPDIHGPVNVRAAGDPEPMLTRLGTCEASLPLTPDCTFTAAPIADQRDVACDPAAAAADDYPYATTIALTFTPAERAVYEAKDAAANQDDFAGSLALGGAPIRAKLHFRGQSSLACARKSLGVDLDGSEPYRLMPGAAEDDFLLISLCLDPGYFHQAFAERILAEAGAFPLERRFVRLTVDGEDRGVYWLLEQPHRTLVADALAPRAVLRRRFDPDGRAPEVKYGDEREALARYRALTAMAKTGDPAQLAGKIDLDTYWFWLALASLTENGDHVDEVYFYASEEAGDWYFRPMGWDPDDLGSPCHHGGQYALADRCALLYCAEGDLDHALIRSEDHYARYRAILAELLMSYPAERLRAELDAVLAELEAVLVDDATAAAMVELGATSAAQARTRIRALADGFLADLEARRAVLQAGLAGCTP